MKYPNVIFFRYEKYNYIDNILGENQLECNINITSDKFYLKNLFNSNYHVLVTFGNSSEEYYKDVYEIITENMVKKWFHLKNLDNIDNFNYSVNYCYIHSLTCNFSDSRPEISIFTTCFNSFNVIERPYKSLKNQTINNWEWVILDDSGSEDHFNFLKDLFKDETNIRLYKNDKNSGSIGNVKNDAVSLCRGKYVLELDHDDEIVDDLLEDSIKIFENDIDVGFIYTNYTNIYEDGNNYSYGNFFSLGYGGYYLEKYKDKWVFVSRSPNINNVTLSHIVSVPNHARIWKKKILLEIGNYNEYLPICDDYELLLRTAINTKIVKLNKLGYIQYMNNNNNNFSLIRNREINKLCKDFIYPIMFKEYNINEIMKKIDSYEDEKYITEPIQIWKRNNFNHQFCNKIISNYKKIYCIITVNSFENNINYIKSVISDDNDFILLDNLMSNIDLCNYLDKNNFSNFKCYSIDLNKNELINYFLSIYCGGNDYEIII